MTVEQLAKDYKQLMAVTNSLATALRALILLKAIKVLMVSVGGAITIVGFTKVKLLLM